MSQHPIGDEWMVAILLPPIQIRNSRRQHFHHEGQRTARVGHGSLCLRKRGVPTGDGIEVFRLPGPSLREHALVGAPTA